MKGGGWPFLSGPWGYRVAALCAQCQLSGESEGHRRHRSLMLLAVQVISAMRAMFRP